MATRQWCDVARSRRTDASGRSAWAAWSPAVAAAGVAIGLGAGAALAGAGEYGPPTGYYSNATGTGAALKAQLHQIVSTGVRFRNYDAARQALQIIDADPTTPGNIVCVYDGRSIPGTWQAGQTWNREHTWPRSRGVGSSGPDNSDLHMLRPCWNTVNSARGNEPFGTAGSQYWDPNVFGERYRGDMARAMFYADVRYDGGESGTVDLTLDHGYPSGNEMGDLAELLDWHYREMPDERERRRNHLVYSQQANPSYYQNNRNPFVDRPEFVWTIFGDGPNQSTLFVGGSFEADGSSAAIVDLGAFASGVGGALEDVPLTIAKSGPHPTTFALGLSGVLSPDDADAVVHQQGFPASEQEAVVLVDVTVPAAAGAYLGSMTVDNTDVSSAGLGTGSQDGDDEVLVVFEVLDAAEVEAQPSADGSTVMIDLGVVVRGGSAPSEAFSICNAEATPGFTDAAVVDAVTLVGEQGEPGAVTLSLPGAAGGGSPVILAGACLEGLVTVDTLAPVGEFAAGYTIELSPERLADQTALGAVSVIVTGEIVLRCDAPGLSSDPCADITGDGTVDLQDLNALLPLFNTPTGDNVDADTNCDGIIDFADLNNVLAAFGEPQVCG